MHDRPGKRSAAPRAGGVPLSQRGVDTRASAKGVIAGRYRVEHALSHGSLSLVVAARCVDTRLPVAIKALCHEHLRDPTMLGRFDREAAALRQSQSEHVVRLLDVGSCSVIGPYIVMERLEGKDLGQRLAEGPLGLAAALEYARQTCQALEVIHAAGIVHHDLKPENLFLAQDGIGERIQLIDFGISQQGRPEPADREFVIGTPAYMAPERLMGDESCDRRCDIWSFGVTLHELITGRVPFSGSDDAELCRRIASGEPPNLVKDPALLPQGLRAIIRRCLMTDPAERYRDVAQVSADLCRPMPLHGRMRGRITGSFERSLLARCSAHFRERARRRRT